MSKAQLEFILGISAQNPPPENATPGMMRDWFEAINAQTPIADGSMIERVSAGPCGGDMIRRAETDERRLVIYYHGGGFFFGSSRSHRVIASHLARASGVGVLAADYRLAPENPAPVAHSPSTNGHWQRVTIPRQLQWPGTAPAAISHSRSLSGPKEKGCRSQARWC